MVADQPRAMPAFRDRSFRVTAGTRRPGRRSVGSACHIIVTSSSVTLFQLSATTSLKQVPLRTRQSVEGFGGGDRRRSMVRQNRQGPACRGLAVHAGLVL